MARVKPLNFHQSLVSPDGKATLAFQGFLRGLIPVVEAFSDLTGDLDDIPDGSTNVGYTQAEKTKLAGVETSATADQTDGEIQLGWEASTGITATNIVLRDGSIPFTGPVEVPSYTVAGLPSAATDSRVIYVSNETGGATLAFSDGTNWRRVQDRAIVS